jgi:endonuclease/exonuclease/phosphatase (EEP) superfamily protein YafD
MRTLRLALTLLLGPPLVALAVVCAGVAVAAQWGRVDLGWDIFAHFAHLSLLGGLTAMAAGFAFRGLLLLALGLVAVAGSAVLVVPEFLRPTGPKAPANAAGQLKVVQLNAWASNVDPGRTVDWLIAQDPDVVVLEETRPGLRKLIRERTDWRTTCRECEVMIFSKAEPTAVAARPIAYATFRDARGEFTVLGVHEAWPTDIADQQAQEARLAKAIGRFPRGRTIVVGDFNASPWSFSRRRWDEAFGLIRRDRALLSWPASHTARGRWLAPLPFLPIDHVYAGADWATVKVERGPKLGSDHYPVILTLAPRGP